MQSKLHRKALRLSIFTVGYNVAEAVASIVLGWLAGSIALVGFGLDSLVESLSGAWLLGALVAQTKARSTARAVSDATQSQA